jgi:tetratricopeptide (TPR) repeat protein
MCAAGPIERPARDSLLSDELVREQLERVLGSPQFSSSRRLSGFLRFVVERSLADDIEGIKEYQIGTEVYGRGPEFDPRTDNIVRVEANRLRARLRDYYQQAESADPVRIEIPKGAYVPVFHRTAPALIPELVPERPDSVRRRRFVPRRLFWSAVIAAAIILACGITLWRWHPGMKPRPAIAVLGLKRLNSQSSDWISTACAEMLSTDLAGSDRMRTLPADTIAVAKRDLGLPDSDGFPADSLHRIRRRTGADIIVSGAYLEVGDQLRLDLRVQDTRSGEVIGTFSETGSPGALFDVVDRAASGIRTALRLPQPSHPALIPGAAGAMQLYAEGLEQFRRFNLIAARDLLQRATDADPSNSLAQSALAASLRALGFQQQAREVAQRAWQTSTQLSRMERLEVEGRYRQYAGEWDQAIRIYQSLYTTAPDDVDDAFMLIDAQRGAGRPVDAMKVIERLRKLPPPLRDDPRIDFKEAMLYGDLSDFNGARHSASEAARKALASGARLLYAKALLFESGTMLDLGIPGADELRDRARALCSELGDRMCVLQALRVDANVSVPGNPERARELYERGLQVAGEIGAMDEQVNLLNGLGAAFTNLNDLSSAEKSYREALRIAHEISSQGFIDGVELELADLELRQGRLPEARELYSQALTRFRVGSYPEFRGRAEASLAAVLRLQGQLTQARALSEEAIGEARSTGHKEAIEDALLVSSDILVDMGELDLAGSRCREIVSLQNEAPYPGLASLAQAKLALAHRDHNSAQAHATTALQQFLPNDADDRALTQAVLIEAFLGKNDKTSAIQLAKQSHKFSVINPHARWKLELAVADAEANQDAVARVAAVRQQAVQLGYAGIATEASSLRARLIKRSDRILPHPVNGLDSGKTHSSFAPGTRPAE